MTDLDTMKFSCQSPDQLIEHSHDIVTALPDGPRQRFRDILLDYTARYAMDEVYNLLNNRTISEIFREYEPSDKATNVVESGELDGVRYTLYEAPDETESSGDDDEEAT